MFERDAALITEARELAKTSDEVTARTLIRLVHALQEGIAAQRRYLSQERVMLKDLEELRELEKYREGKIHESY